MLYTQFCNCEKLSVCVSLISAGTVKHKLLSLWLSLPRLSPLLCVMMEGIKGLTEQNNTTCCLLRSLDLVTLRSLTYCLCLQPSWVFTRWSPVVKHTTGLQVKRVTTVSTIIELNLLIQRSQKDWHLDLFWCLFPRCDQRGEDEPSVWWTSQSH